MTDVPARLQGALSDRYRLERELGQGGMATVYLATDLRHQRSVALKVLRPELAATMGPERFHREIEIAAQLQHPNILPLLDSGQAAAPAALTADGRRLTAEFLYYVMPFVEGHSLRERLAKEGELPVPEAARILRDVADALSAAHAKGVVHRDIKPENVLLTGRHALVADFGVAKAVSEATGRQALTTAGVALGTPTYMAPEQAAASPHVDHRADLYAFGVMAYEMLTGQPPFTAGTPQALLAAHVTEPPLEVTQRRATIPAPLAQLIMRCLAKKAADRPQSADELLPVLESFSTPTGGVTPTQTQPVLAVAARRRLVPVGVVAGVVALVAVAAVAVRFLGHRPLAITLSDVTQVTSAPGVEFHPAISPDGKEVAFVAGPILAPHLVIRSAANAAGGEVRPADTSLGSVYLPAWSTDGDVVRFAACRPASIDCLWYETGKLGGAVLPASVPRAARASVLTSSPDGNSVAFTVGDTILVASASDSGARRIAVHPAERAALHSLAWSPDGGRIAYVDGNWEWLGSGNVLGSSIWVVNAAGGEPRRITADGYLNVSPAWLDARHLVFVSNRDGQRAAYVVEVGPHGARGEPRIVPGVADPHSVSYSIATRTLAWAKFTLRQNVRAYPLGRPAPVSIGAGLPVTTGNQVIEASDVSPDGRWLAFDSQRRGNMDLYRMPLAGGEPVPLTTAPWDEWDPRWSPDGSEIAFYADVRRSGGGSNSIMVMPAEGGAPVALTTGAHRDAYPSWSPDGLHIAFVSTRTGRNEVWLVSRDGVGAGWHEPAQLTDFSCWEAAWAADGSGVVCRSGSTLVSVSPERRVLRRLDVAALSWLGAGYRYLRSSRDGRTIYTGAAHPDGRRGIWAIPVAGGPPRLVVSYDDPALTNFANMVSVGPDRLYLTVAEYESDVWVAKLRF